MSSPAVHRGLLKAALSEHSEHRSAAAAVAVLAGLVPIAQGDSRKKS